MKPPFVSACPTCGAPFPKQKGVCDYCGQYIIMYEGPEMPTAPAIPTTGGWGALVTSSAMPLSIASYGMLSVGTDPMVVRSTWR